MSVEICYSTVTEIYREKIKTSTDDEDALCKLIVDKLSKNPGLSYAEIAKTAYNAGQTRLATKVSIH